MVGSFDTINDVDWYHPYIHLYNGPTIALNFHVHHFFIYMRCIEKQVTIKFL